LTKLNTDVLYFPLYTVDGVNVTQMVHELGITSALISSDGLLSGDFAKLTEGLSQGMYFSGPAPVPESEAFVKDYTERYGEEPMASYHLQAYDAAMILFASIEQASSSSSGSLIIGRQAVRDALRSIRNVDGLSGPLTCSQYGDCGEPDISIFQVRDLQFTAIYP
jgi:branched-chain amino acid transport system substrate-binding protein